ncbi:hypothetical protein C9J85_15565 [Haloferax sp. wsp5]|nr:hypothetical protein C9J85_15565 [Haloferax sp. wsp5]
MPACSVRGRSARATIGTVFVAAVLSVAIGILNISSPVAGGVLAFVGGFVSQCVLGTVSAEMTA